MLCCDHVCIDTREDLEWDWHPDTDPVRMTGNPEVIDSG